MYTQNQALLDAIKSKGVLIAAHRGNVRRKCNSEHNISVQKCTITWRGYD